MQDQIDAIPDQDFSWGSITGKPSKFPPEPHTHPTSDVNGLDDALSQIEGDITDLEGAVGSLSGQLAMGGSYDAATGLVVTANLSGFEEGQPLPDYSTVQGTFVIVVVAGDNPEPLGEADWLVAGESGWVAIKYGSASLVDWDNISNVPPNVGLWEQNGDDIYYNDGNVGIGTDSPSGKLSVSDNGANGIEITPNSSRWGNMILSWDRVAGNSSPLSYRADSYKFYTTSDENDPKLTIDSSGNATFSEDVND